MDENIPLKSLPVGNVVTQAGQSKASADFNGEDRHLQMIQIQTEHAKDSSVYEIYDYKVSTEDSHLKLFSACSKGTKHVIEKIPCQDYCMTESVNGCTILADADGVSACELSDIGSRFACEAVVKTVMSASKSSKSEEQLVKRILSVTFREKLVSMWVSMVMEEIQKVGILSPAEQLKEFSKYGATIMFAVITDNWYIVGNLGDGQILVFNDAFGIKVRVHAPKDSSIVRCLANERCAREDFQIEKFHRTFFNGILLSTDGIYESMDKGTHFYEYAIQMKKRFLNRLIPEPYQPFCYEEYGEPFKDFSKMRTQDDCSIVLAIDESPGKKDFSGVYESVMRHAEAVLPKRWGMECFSFYVKRDSQYFDVVITPKRENSIPKKLNTAIVEEPEETWIDEDFSLAAYNPIEADTIEFMHCTGKLRRDKKNPDTSEQRILLLYSKLKSLLKELRGLGYTLNSSAHFLVSFDGKNLFVKKEAVIRLLDQKMEFIPECIESRFSHILGVLETSGSSVPVFDIGYIDRGVKFYRMDELSRGELGQLVQEKREVKLKNTSGFSWRLTDGENIESGETVDLRENLIFTILDEQGKKIAEYKYRSKEYL